MLLLQVMTTLIKLICVNTALFSITDQDGKGLAVVDEHDFSVTPAGDDDVLKEFYVKNSCFSLTGRGRSSCKGGCKRILCVLLHVMAILTMLFYAYTVTL